MIRAIAFDFMGVLGGENDIDLDIIDEKLEKQFGNLNYQIDYFKWAQSETGLKEEELRKRVSDIIHKIYHIKEPELMIHLGNSGYKLALATNHLAYLSDWLESIDYLKYFDVNLNSDTTNAQKPEKKYYQKLIEELNVEPEEILFIDDREENTKGAEILGIQTILYKSKKDGPLLNILESTLR